MSRAVYLIYIDNRIIALRRHGHHPQNTQYDGAILSHEATPIDYGGTTYYPKSDIGDGRKNLPTYTCRKWQGDDDTIEQATGLKIQDMKTP